MLKHLSLVVMVGLLSSSSQAKLPEQGACFVLTRVENGQEKKVTPEQILPTGSRLRFHVEARKQPCTVVASAFRRGQARETSSLLPLQFRLQPNQQGLGDFEIKEPLKASELFVVVVPQSSNTSEELIRLVQGWREQPKQSQGPRTALHDRLSFWLAKQDTTLNNSGPVPKELGGVRSSSAQAVNPTGGKAMEAKTSARPRAVPLIKEEASPAYDWLPEADWLPCSTGLPGVFVYRLGK